MSPGVMSALVSLLASWQDWSDKRAWYLAEFVPKVVEQGATAGRNDLERSRLRALRRELSYDEWNALGLLLVRVEASAERQRADNAAEEKKRRHRRQRSREYQRRAIAGREAEAAAQRKADAQARAERERERQRVIAHDKAVGELWDEVDRRLSADYTGVRAWLAQHPDRNLLAQEQLEERRIALVAQWCHAELRDLDPSEEQAAAIGHVDGHVLVRARAGSGKTATLAARAAFLIKHCKVDPDRVLMLAFNSEAAARLRSDVERHVGVTHVPHVMTFHALAYRLVHPLEDLLYDEDDHRAKQSRAVQDLVNVYVRDEKWQPRIRALMLDYFRRDWQRILRRGDDLQPAEQIALRRGLERETLRGEFVKSEGERSIGNLLFEHDIDYRYERAVSWGEIPYRPDFSVYVGDRLVAVIEYFGLKGDAKYDRQAAAKKGFWEKNPDVELIELYSVADSSWGAAVLSRLNDCGCRPRKQSDEELWSKVKARAIDRFTRSVTQLVNRARQRRWSSDDLRDVWSRYDNDEARLEEFIDVAASVLDDYEERLKQEGEEDFTGLMWKAVDRVAREGRTAWQSPTHGDGDLSSVRYLMVDEFQDFSLMFHEMTQQVVAVGDDVRVMGVGDDWQAINEFAGSTLEYFQHFETAFPGARMLELTTNRRSVPEVVELGNVTMAGLGTPARALRDDTGTVRRFLLEDFRMAPEEEAAFGMWPVLTPALLRLVGAHLAAGRNVAVLSRKGNRTIRVRHGKRDQTFKTWDRFGSFVGEVLGVDDPKRLVFSTTHGFKGEEREAVVVVGADQYPLIHPTWPLYQVFGDDLAKLEAAERRLFYVALSRAEEHLDIIDSAEHPCGYLDSDDARRWMRRTEWDELPVPACVHTQGTIRVEVYQTYNVWKQLKDDQFTFNDKKKCWWRAGFSQDLTPSWLKGRPWIEDQSIRLEVWRGADRLIASVEELRRLQ